MKTASLRVALVALVPALIWAQAGMSVAQSPPAATSSSLPGGASSVQEAYQDWRVVCEQNTAGKRCALTHTQVQQNGQRVLAIELHAPSGTAISGTLILPFGLALAKGATLQIDDKAIGQPLPFRTCLPAGCVVSLNFDAPMLATLKTGTTLKVKTVTDDGKEAPFSVPLAGFAAALERVAVLSR